MTDGTSGWSEKRLEHIKRDYDRACSLVARLDDRVKSIRTWNITIIVAYLGWMTQTCGGNDIWPLLAPIFGFWMLEAFTKATIRFHACNTLAKVDGLYFKEARDRFFGLVSVHKFMSQYEDSEYKKWWTKEGVIHRLLRGAFNVETFAFYFVPLLSVATLLLLPWCWLVSAFVVFLGLIVFIVCYRGVSHWWKDKGEVTLDADDRTDSGKST